MIFFNQYKKKITKSKALKLLPTSKLRSITLFYFIPCSLLPIFSTLLVLNVLWSSLFLPLDIKIGYIKKIITSYYTTVEKTYKIF